MDWPWHNCVDHSYVAVFCGSSLHGENRAVGQFLSASPGKVAHPR